MLHTGLVAPWHMESSRTRDQTRVSCIARRILYHWAAREAWKAESWPLDLQGSPCMSSFILWHWLWATPCPVHCRTLLGGAWARIYFSVAFPSLSLFFFFFSSLKTKVPWEHLQVCLSLEKTTGPHNTLGDLYSSWPLAHVGGICRIHPGSSSRSSINWMWVFLEAASLSLLCNILR